MSEVAVDKVAAIVHDAGGRVIGRTRLQKIAYLLTASGLESGFDFEYKHYGPFSEEVAKAARQGRLSGRIIETEHHANWGGSYSVFVVSTSTSEEASDARHRILEIATRADAVELELAATAIFLANTGYSDAWGETAKRKPEKVDGGRLEGARRLLGEMLAVKTPVPLPAIG